MKQMMPVKGSFDIAIEELERRYKNSENRNLVELLRDLAISGVAILDITLARIFHQISVAIAASLVWALRSWRFRDLFVATTCLEVASLKGLSSASPVCESAISRRN